MRADATGPLPRARLQSAFWIVSTVVFLTFQIINGSGQFPGILIMPLVWGLLGYGASSILGRLGERWRVVEQSLPVIVGLGLTGVFVATIAVTGAIVAIGAGLGGRIEPRSVANIALIVASTLASWSAAALMVAQLHRVRDAEARALAARLQMLRHQLNPHFLFNSLNSLAATIDEDRDRAQRLLVDLSNLLRAALADDSDAGTLGDELERVERFLRIERARFEEKLDVQTSVPDELRRAACLPLLLQPLVENAIKHGGIGAGVEVRLVAARQDQRIRIQISNPVRVGSTHGSGIGLANVRERLATRYGARHRFAQEQRADGWMVVELEWPLELGS